jgi:translation initiation factor RLI1
VRHRGRTFAVALAQRVTQYFRGSELQNYFHKMLEDKLKAIIKPQVHVCVWLCVCVCGCVWLCVRADFVWGLRKS